MINNISRKPIIYLIRHARSVYNEAEQQLQHRFQQLTSQQFEKTPQYNQMKFVKNYQDCDITQRGYPQCQQCREKMKDIDLDLILVSPLRRALSTCARVFKDHKSKAPVIVDPIFREIFQSKCDIGSRLKLSMKDYPHFDYSLIQNPDTWYIQTMKNESQKSKIQQKLKQVDQKQQNKAAQELMLSYLKDLWQRRQEDPDVKSEALSPVEIQKAKLKMLIQKYNSIAIVTHSENIKSYVGYKPKNCSILIYKSQYFDQPISEVKFQQL